jgi:hypothetical protein
MRRRRHGRALTRRYGIPAPGEVKLSMDQRHAYKEILRLLRNNPGMTRSELRVEMQSWSIHRAVVERVLSVAERRGHVEVRGGRYYTTSRGADASFGTLLRGGDHAAT